MVQLLAHFTLGEPWGVVPIAMSVFAAIGVLIISKPPFLVAAEVKADYGKRLVLLQIYGYVVVDEYLMKIKRQ